MPTNLLCPSALDDRPNAVVFGVVDNQGDTPAVAALQNVVPLIFIRHLIPATVAVAEVVRVASNCAEDNCRHFTGHDCSLIHRIVADLPKVVRRLSSCAVRGSCRWWHQERAQACFRCPQIVTAPHAPSTAMIKLATPNPHADR